MDRTAKYGVVWNNYKTKRLQGKHAQPICEFCSAGESRIFWFFDENDNKLISSVHTALSHEENMTTDLRLSAPNNGGVCTMSTNEAFTLVPIQRSSALEKRLERLRKQLPYQFEYVKETFSDELWEAMEYRDISQAQFARKAKVPKQFLTKVFRGGNCTIETMVRLAFALNYKLNIHLTPNEMGCAWIHAIPESTPRPPDKFLNLWFETGYQPIANVKKEVKCDHVTSTS
jgi:transcriptional regulator with XRE-family HTH domain